MGYSNKKIEKGAQRLQNERSKNDKKSSSLEGKDNKHNLKVTREPFPFPPFFAFPPLGPVSKLANAVIVVAVPPLGPVSKLAIDVIVVAVTARPTFVSAQFCD